MSHLALRLVVCSAGVTFTAGVTLAVEHAGRGAPPGVHALQAAASPSNFPEFNLQGRADRGHEFYFTRAIFSGGRGFRGRGAWSTDFPKADRQFLYVLSNLLEVLDPFPHENPVRLDDPELRRYPFLYALEVGYMQLSQAEVDGLRGYLEAGGFLFVDDFWGSFEWANFEREMARVLPDRRIVEVPLEHPIFHQFYDIEQILQVPNLQNGVQGGPTHERDGYVPRVLGIFDDADNLMVLINWNTDLGDAWEWSENPFYPFRFSNFAYEMAVNSIIYSMSH